MKPVRSSRVLLAGYLLAFGCGDSPSQVREAASVSMTGTFPAEANAGTAVSPAVLVRDASDRPAPGIVVTFQVTAGGGSVSQATVNTNNSGLAVLPAWTLGPTPGMNTLIATVAGLPPVTFSIASCGVYCINIRYVGTVSDAHRAAFTNARLRWEQVVSGDLAPVQLNIPAGACKDENGVALVNHPAVGQLVDDLMVYVQIDSIDGPGQVIGVAGPCFIRNTSRLPVFGIMRLDRADLNLMQTQGLLGDVILHELGHTLGLPTIWSDSLFLLLEGAGTNEPYFKGSNAASRFQLAGGTLVNGVGVPVENTGGSGTRDAHWRESVMSTELMTGYISTVPNPLSAITIASLQDIGYQVNFGAADPYMLPGAGPHGGGWSGVRLELVELPMPAPRVVH